MGLLDVISEYVWAHVGNFLVELALVGSIIPIILIVKFVGPALSFLGVPTTIVYAIELLLMIAWAIGLLAFIAMQIDW